MESDSAWRCASLVATVGPAFRALTAGGHQRALLKVVGPREVNRLLAPGRAHHLGKHRVPVSGK